MRRQRAGGRATGRSDLAPEREEAGLESLRHRLAGAATTLQIDLPPLAVDSLLAFVGLLRRWNRVYNLTALRDAEAMGSGHLIDCLAIVPALRRYAAGRSLRVLDAGSGGGLPGVMLAIVFPAWEVVCADAVAKKAAFVRQVAVDLQLGNLQALHSRVESLPGADRRFDLIVSRAFASLFDFTQWTAAAIAPGGVWAAMKARPVAAELERLPSGVELFHVEQLAVPGVDAERCLVWMRRSGSAEQRYSIHGEDLLHR